MKKFSIYIILIILIFAIPAIFTRPFDAAQTLENSVIDESQSIDKSEYDYKSYSTIKLLDDETGEISEINLDEYLLGVVSAEMPASYSEEALKAQAVVARTYTLYTITHNKDKHGEGVICTSSSCCQAWISKENRLAKWEDDEKYENWNKIEMAVYQTKGEVIEYDGKVIDAFFHSNSGGVTERPENVWGGTDFPYLQVVETAGEEGYSQYSSEVQLSKSEFEKKFLEKYSDFAIDWESEDCIKILDYTDSGRAKTVKIGNKEISGVAIRTILGLKSANFKFEINDDYVKISVTGYRSWGWNESNGS